MSLDDIVAKDSRANLIRAFKATGCVTCGLRYPDCEWADLHIDHIDARDKPAHAVAARLTSSNTRAILAELLVCQVLCRPCHLKKHNGTNGAEQQLRLFNGSGDFRYHELGYPSPPLQKERDVPEDTTTEDVGGLTGGSGTANPRPK